MSEDKPPTSKSAITSHLREATVTIVVATPFVFAIRFGFDAGWAMAAWIAMMIGALLTAIAGTIRRVREFNREERRREQANEGKS